MGAWRGIGLDLRMEAGFVLAALAVPQGYTLTQAGTMALMLGHRGFPGLLGIWAFVSGAGLAFIGLALLTRAGSPTPAHRAGWPRAVATFNLTASAAVCASGTCAWWITNRDLAFLVAGATGVCLYAFGVTALVAATGWATTRRVEKCSASDQPGTRV